MPNASNRCRDLRRRAGLPAGYGLTVAQGWVLGISAGAVALWLLVWALLFRGRLGLG